MTKEQERQPVEVRVADVRRLPKTEGKPSWCVVLLESEDGRLLPIWMGESEGIAVAVGLAKVEVPRPLTFAFMAGLLDAAGHRLSAIRITRLEQNTFYAVASVDGPGGIRTVDARPSDALALALQTGAKMHVDPAVLDAQAAWNTAHPDQSLSRERMNERTEGAVEIVASIKSAWEQQSSPASDLA